MKFGMYCMQDLKTGFLTPTIDQTDASAIRNFDSAILQSQGVLFTHAEDFRLFRIGEFDSESGVVEPLAMPVVLRDGASVLRGDRHDV